MYFNNKFKVAIIKSRLINENQETGKDMQLICKFIRKCRRTLRLITIRNRLVCQDERNIFISTFLNTAILIQEVQIAVNIPLHLQPEAHTH